MQNKGEIDPLALISDPEGGYVVNDYFPYWLVKLAEQWKRSFSRTIKKSGMSMSRWRVLAVVCSNSGISVNEVAESASLEQTSASRIVDQLATEGLLRRQTSQTDGRSVVIRGTEKGFELFREIWPAAYEDNRKRMQRLTRKEEETLLRLIRKLVDE